MTMSEQAEKNSTLENWTALSTAIIAVFLSISSILNGQADDDTLVFRGKANNAWAYFQSKSIKQNLYEISLHTLNLQLKNNTYSPEYKDSIRAEIGDVVKRIEKYEKEKAEIKAAAEENDAISEAADSKSNWYDLAEAFYQIAIVMAAISLIAKNRKMWIFSCALGVAAITLTSYAFFFVG